VPQHPRFPKPLAKTAKLVYNQIRNRGIFECPTVAQTETYNGLKNINGLQGAVAKVDK